MKKLLNIYFFLFFSMLVIEDGTAKNFNDEQLTASLNKMLESPQVFIEQHQSKALTTYQDFKVLFVLAKALDNQGKRNEAIYTLKNGLDNSASLSLDEAFEIRLHFNKQLAQWHLQSNQLMQARDFVSAAIDHTKQDDVNGELIELLRLRAKIDKQLNADIGALQDLQLAFQLAITANDLAMEAKTALDILRVHQDRNEHSIAVTYASQAIQLARQHGDIALLAEALVYSSVSLVEVNRLDDASLRLNELQNLPSNNTYLRALSSLLQATISLKRGLYEESIELAKMSITQFSENNLVELAKLHLLMSRAHNELNNTDIAIETLITAFNLLRNQPDSFELLQSLHIHRAELLARLDQYDEAFKVTRDLIEARELNRPIDEIKRMLDMHTNFQLQLQQQENAELRSKNEAQTNEIENRKRLTQLNYAVIILLFLSSALLLILFIRNRNHRKSLEKIAHVDHLTGAFSRRRILEILDYQHDMFLRNDKKYTLAILDLDHFKKINDQHGHDVGDKVLMSFIKLAKEDFRKTDSIGRIGGEEFLFIFPETPLKEGERLLTVFSERVREIGEELKLKGPVTVSGGIIEANKNKTSREALKLADVALYEAKNNGRDQVVIADSI